MKTILFFILLLSIPYNLACNQYMDHNSENYNSFKAQYISIEKNESGLTEEQFGKVMTWIYDIYQPIFKNRGGNLVFPETNWENSQVNGTVRRENGDWKVLVYGGYARHKLATIDALLFITCHEIGHHLGETAYYGGAYTWASAEGQADYYSTLKCMRLVLKGKDNQTALDSMKIPTFLKEQCEKEWSEKEDQLICQRSSMAGYQMTQIWKNGRGKFKFSTPSRKIVRTTSIRHPAHQCRIDTYLQGALCNKEAYEDVSRSSYKIGTCTLADNYKKGIRPACWFKENLTTL